MSIKILNTTLLVVTVIGALLAYRAGNEHREVLAEHTRLEAKVGRLPIRDRSKLHVLSLETGDDLLYTWRVYIPADFAFYCHSSRGQRGWRAGSDTPYERVYRLRLRVSDDGVLQVYEDCFGSSTMLDIGDRKFAEFIRERWNEVAVEQLGANKIAVIDADEVATLLRITLSDELMKEAKRKFGNSLMGHDENSLYHIRIGSRKAMRQAGLSER